jgi:hypothetical protein
MLTADNPGERLWVGDVEETLEFSKLVFVHRRQMRISEAAHDEIHLADASTPSAKQNPPPALIERGTAQSRARHQGPFHGEAQADMRGLIRSSTRAAAAGL